MAMIDINSLDGRLMRLFLAVFDQGSVSRAADQLNLNQSTVSHGLDRLRTLLGDPLFVREGRGITPSDGARALEPKIRQIVCDLEGLVHGEAFVPSRETAPITIACNVTELLPQLVACKTRLQVEAPCAQIRLLDLGARTNTEAILATNQADLVITVKLTTYPASLLNEPWLQDRFTIFFDPECRGPIESLQDFADARHAALDFGGGKQSMLTNTAQRLGLDRKVVMTTSNIYALSEMLRGTSMIATMQSRYAETVFRGFARSALPFPMEAAVYDLVWHRRRATSPKILWLLDILRSIPDRQF